MSKQALTGYQYKLHVGVPVAIVIAVLAYLATIYLNLNLSPAQVLEVASTALAVGALSGLSHYDTPPSIGTLASADAQAPTKLLQEAETSIQQVIQTAQSLKNLNVALQQINANPQTPTVDVHSMAAELSAAQSSSFETILQKYLGIMPVQNNPQKQGS